MQTLVGIIAAVSPLTALLGVGLGSRLGRQHEAKQWVRNQRQHDPLS